MRSSASVRGTRKDNVTPDPGWTQEKAEGLAKGSWWTQQASVVTDNLGSAGPEKMKGGRSSGLNKTNTKTVGPAGPAQAECIVEAPEGKSGVLENALLLTEKYELADCEAVIKTGLETFFEVGEALNTIRVKRLYRAEYATFEEYCQKKWQFTARRARQLCDAAEVRETLRLSFLADATAEGVGGSSPEEGAAGLASAAMGTIVPLPESESQARELKAVPAEEQAQVYKEAWERTGKGASAPTARVIREVVAERKMADGQMANGKWPKANEWGVYDEALAEVFEMKTSHVECGVKVLQIGKKGWIGSHWYQFKRGDHIGACGPLKDSWISWDRETAVEHEAELLMGSLGRDKKTKDVRKVLDWATTLIDRAQKGNLPGAAAAATEKPWPLMTVTLKQELLGTLRHARRSLKDLSEQMIRLEDFEWAGALRGGLRKLEELSEEVDALRIDGPKAKANPRSNAPRSKRRGK